MKSPGPFASFFFLLWFSVLIFVFVVVTVPAEGRLAGLLPVVFWKVRDVIYPLFFSPSIL